MLPTCEPRVFHIKAHIFHLFSQNVINCPMWSTCISQTSTVESHVSQNSTWNTHTCTLIPHSKNYMWMHVEKNWTYTAENPQLNPVWHYIPHEMHILAHYFHTARRTCGYMWKSLNMNIQKSTAKPRVALYSTWNAHACTLIPHNNINMWMHVENCEHKQHKIHGQIPCDTTFHMKCTYLHNIFTQ